VPTDVTAFAPATVANVGIGFDILGHTVDAVGDRVRLRRIEEPTVRIRSICGIPGKISLDPNSNTAGRALQAMRAALELFASRPPGTLFSVNLSAPVLLDRHTLELLAHPLDLSGLIIEVTEEALVQSEAELQQAIAPLRARGAMLAVDDMGAGYSGLRQITTVRPSYLKLDRSLITGIDEDDDRQALVGALVGYAAHVGSLLVARRGVPLTLIFDRREASPCSDEIVLPDFGIRRALPANARTAIEILPDRVGEFPFSCGMNMLHGKIRVVA